MVTQIINPGKLKKLKPDMKVHINSGRWFLYGIENSKDPSIKFALFTNGGVFYLNSKGKPMYSEKDRKLANCSLLSRVYFKGVKNESTSVNQDTIRSMLVR